MLHGVRFLQSQLHARVAEFSLKDWLSTFKEHEFSEANVVSHARKAHRDAKIHSFLSGVAIAVEGELPSRGLVLVAADNVDFALRVLSSLTPVWSPSGQSTSFDSARQTMSQAPTSQPLASQRILQTAATALAEGVLVAWPMQTLARVLTAEVVRMAARSELPIVGATVEESARTPSADPLDALLARRDVLVTVGTLLASSEAEALVSSECTRLAGNIRAKLDNRSRDWKPADAAALS